MILEDLYNRTIIERSRIAVELSRAQANHIPQSFQDHASSIYLGYTAIIQGIQILNEIHTGSLQQLSGVPVTLEDIEEWFEITTKDHAHFEIEYVLKGCKVPQ